MKAEGRSQNTSPRPSPQRGEGAPKVTANGLLKPGQKYLTRIELARVLNVSVRKVDSMIAAREVPVLHLGKMVRFRLEDVERRLNKAMLTDSEDYDTANTPTA